MPTYQYSCTQCGHFFEQFQSFSDASLTDCPECEGRLRKVFNAVGVVFKGSGFYRNDSRAPEGGEKVAAGSGSGTASGASSSTSTSSGDKSSSSNGSGGSSSSSNGSGASSSSSGRSGGSSTAGSAA